MLLLAVPDIKMMEEVLFALVKVDLATLTTKMMEQEKLVFLRLVPAQLDIKMMVKDFV